MSSLKRKNTNAIKVEEESYVQEINTETETAPYEAQHPMLAALEAHLSTSVDKVDHLERYTEVSPFE
tara:strand:+ start:449 stop:649 length:201 start_codon:yes stop_codon:yes gene_type:complete